MKQYLCLDFGGTFVKYGLLDEKGTFLKQGKVKADIESLEAMLESIKPLAAEFKGQYEGVAVSMPGRINTHEGIAYTGGAYKFIKDTPFGAKLEEIFGTKVVLGNDGKCAAAAEVFDGALSDVDNGCVIVMGTATGGGIVLNKKIWMGTSFGGGELSNVLRDYTPINNPKDMGEMFTKMWCGVASATGLVMKYAVKKGLDPWTSGLDGVKVFEAYDANEQDAKDALAEFADGVAAGIMTIQAVLDLEKYAIGGGISARKEVTEAIRDAVNARYDANPAWPFMKPAIETCKYGNDANLLGALSFYLEETK